MDYVPVAREAIELKKYQWDLIHDPEIILLTWLEKEEEGEIGIFGVTWLGNILFGLYPDEQEKEIETRLELFNHIHQEYEKYYSNSKAKDVYISIDKYKSWSVRKASYQGIAKKVFEGLKTNDNTFTLHNEGIYFEDYTLEGKHYKVAVYSVKENIELSKNIRIKSFSELRYNKVIKAGYTKNYGLISFYDTEGKMHMVIQIIGENPEKDVKQWLNYLGLILPSKEQEEKDKEIINKILDAILHNLDELNKIWGEEEKRDILWESNVSKEFKTKVIKISEELEIDPDYLMAIMAFESGETFSSSVKNPYSGATGLIQFMPQTAINLGTTISDLEKMSSEDQLDYVKQYFKPYAGKLKDLCDLYMVVLYPVGVGKSEDYVLFEKDSKCYEQNKGLDINKDNKITKKEACAKVLEKYEKGQKNQIKK